MEASRSRVRRLLIGVGAAFGVTMAWTALSLFLGGTSAHAAENPLDLLDDLTSKATGAVTTVVDDVVAPVAGSVESSTQVVETEVIEPVVATAASVPIVGPQTVAVTTEALHTTVGATGDVVEPVAQVLSDDPVSAVADPVIGSLESLPVVGNAVASLSPTLNTGVTGVDTVLSSVGELTSSTTDAVESAMPGPEPWTPTPTPTDSNANSAGVVVSEVHTHRDSVTRTVTPSSANGPGTFTLSVWPSPAVLSAGSFAQTESLFTSESPPSAPATPNVAHPTSSVGSGLNLSSSSAFFASLETLWPCVAGFAGGAHDDALPPAPVFDTDVSPG